MNVPKNEDKTITMFFAITYLMIWDFWVTMHVIYPKSITLNADVFLCIPVQSTGAIWGFWFGIIQD